MTSEQASKIVTAWGIHLEHVSGKLNCLFMASIPESFLPFPIKTIEEALNLVIKQHHDLGNQDAIKALQNSIGHLTAYTNDEEAILKAGQRFSIPEWREKIIPTLEELQKRQVENFLQD